MRSAYLLLAGSSLLIAGACSSYASSDPAADAGSDAASDAPASGTDAGGDAQGLDASDAGEGGFTCATLSPAPFLCADFDETSSVFYNNGMALALAAPTNGAIAARRPPATSPPNALWITTVAGDYAIDVKAPASSIATRLHASLLVDFASFPSAASSRVVALGVNGSSPCFGYVAVETGKIYVESHCGNPDTYAYTIALPALPAPDAWVPLALDVDLGSGKATATIGSAPPIAIDLGSTRPANGAPFATIGTVAGGTSDAGVTVAIDDVVVTVE